MDKNKGLSLNGRLRLINECLKIGHYKSALEFCDSALLAAPCNSMSHYLRGVAFMGLGKMDISSQEFDIAIRFDSGNVEARLMKGLVFAGMGRKDEASKQFDEVKKLCRIGSGKEARFKL